MWFYTRNDTSFSVPLQDLATRFPSPKSTRDIVVYKKGLQKDEISIKKGMFDKHFENIRLVEQPEPNERVKPVMERFFVVAALITFSFIALYKVIYPLVITFMIRPVSAFSTEDYYESNSLTKFFSEEILIFSPHFQHASDVVDYGDSLLSGFGRLSRFSDRGYESSILRLAFRNRSFVGDFLGAVCLVEALGVYFWDQQI